MSGVSGAANKSVTVLLNVKSASGFVATYVQKNTFRMRWVYYTDSGGRRSMAAPGDAVRSVLGHFERIEANRAGARMVRYAVVAVVEEQPVDGVGVQCSRVVVVGDGGELEALADARDDAAYGSTVSEGSPKRC